MALLKLFANRGANSLVASVERPDVFTIPPLTQGDTVSVEFSLVEDNPNAGIGSVSLVNLASYSLKIGLGATPAGDGSVTPFALGASWSLDASQTKYFGSIALNTTQLNTWLGTAATKHAYVEIELRNTATGAYETVYTGQVEIRAQLISSGSAVPLSGDTALGSAEAAATYVPKIGAAGGSIILTSPDGTKQVLLYVDNDGTFHADSI